MYLSCKTTRPLFVIAMLSVLVSSLKRVEQ